MPVFCNSCGGPNNDEARFCSSCGNQITKVSITLSTGTVLDGRYKIIELIKAGGMGAVYKSVDNRLDEPCAVKEMFSNYTTMEDLDYAEKRFYQEAKTLAKLRHINLPRVIDHFKYQGKFYLVMDFIEGEDLEAILKREGKGGLSEKRVVEYSIQILDVLAYLHNQPSPIVYRDLKPPNIMIQRSDGKVMLIDFGIARTVQPGSVTKKTAVGTEGYIAPEQYVGKPEPRSDIYSLGATMHHLLTGMEPMLPFHFTPANKINPLISERLNNFIMKALQMKAEDRFSTAEEMKKILQETLTSAVQAGHSNSMAIGVSPRITVVSQPEPVYRTLPKSEEPVYRTLPKSEEPVYRTLPRAEEPVYRTLPRAEEPVYRTLPKSEEPVYRTLPKSEEPVYRTLP
ncbi:MAG: serine/threonine-protein kinase, partial [Candidatus Eremiobacterota bacterium]